MNAQALIGTAESLVADYKGQLAMDESNPAWNNRFGQLDIPRSKSLGPLKCHECKIQIAIALGERTDTNYVF